MKVIAIPLDGALVVRDAVYDVAVDSKRMFLAISSF